MEDYRHIYRQFEAKRSRLVSEAELERERPKLNLRSSLAHVFRQVANRLEPQLLMEVPKPARIVTGGNAT